MKKVKILAFLLCAILLGASAFALVGCSTSIDPYYNTTYTLTGKGLALEWDAKNVYDNGPDQLGSECSYRQLIENYFDQIDWGNHVPTSVDEVVSMINSSIEKYFEGSKGLSFTLTSEKDLSLTITYPESVGMEPITIKMAETQEQFDKLYPNELRFQDGFSQDVFFHENMEGRQCCGVFSYEENGLTYDRIIMFNLSSAYGTNHKTLGDVVAVTCDIPIWHDANGAYSGYWTFESLWQTIYLDSKPVENDYGGTEWSNLVSLTVMPEVSVTKNA